MSLNAKQRAAIILALDPSQIDDFEAGEQAPDLAKMAARTGIDAAILDRIWNDAAALSAFRLDPNKATLNQFAMIPDLEAETLGDIDNARPFFSLSELEAATGADTEELRSVFSQPEFELPGSSFADQALVPALDAGFVLTAETLPPLEMFNALGFRVERRSGLPQRVILYQDGDYNAAALNSAKALARGRILPAMRDAQGFVRFYVPGWLDVWLADGTGRAAAEAILASHGLLITRWNEGADMAEVRLALMPKNRNVLGATLSAVRTLRQYAQVDLVEPKQFAHEVEPDFNEVPDDFLNFDAGNPHWHRAMIRLDEAHSDTRGNEDVTVFVIDSGINLDHPDLRGALRDDWAAHDLDFGCGPNTTSPDSRGVDHGTGVASLAVGRAPTAAAGVQGMAPGVRLLPMRIEARNCDYNNRALAIRAAIRLTPPDGRAVINLSWQTEGSHEGVYLALKLAADAGIAIVTSAGNYRSFDDRQANKPHYPSGYGFPAPLADNGQPLFEPIPAVCSVGAVTSTGAKSSYSYFGDAAVTFAAPGGESGGPGQSLWIAMANAAYGFGQGKSFSAPLVTGALALLLSEDKELPADSAIALLRQTARPLAPDAMLGAGLIDVKAALDRLGSAAQPQSGYIGHPEMPHPPVTQVLDAHAINVNLAEAQDLANVPMLGPITATSIVAARSATGPFGTMEAFRLWLGTDDWAWSELSLHISV
ncbi:S8 family serine peptidase [Octadecabacter sp.]|nr:S8 family serine peptidase [Octadecabacter sp.]